MSCRPRDPMYYDATCAEHIGSPLTDDGRCQEARMIAAEAQVQAVRGVTDVSFDVVDDPSWGEGWFQAMHTVKRALDGEGDE